MSDSEQIGTRRPQSLQLQLIGMWEKERSQSQIYSTSVVGQKNINRCLKTLRKERLVNINGTIVLDKVEGKIYPEVYLESFQLIQVPEGGGGVLVIQICVCINFY